MIKIVFNFKYIYTYACVTNYFFFNNLINYLFLEAFIFWQKKKKCRGWDHSYVPKKIKK